MAQDARTQLVMAEVNRKMVQHLNRALRDLTRRQVKTIVNRASRETAHYATKTYEQVSRGPYMRKKGVLWRFWKIRTSKFKKNKAQAGVVLISGTRQQLAGQARRGKPRAGGPVGDFTKESKVTQRKTPSRVVNAIMYGKHYYPAALQAKNAKRKTRKSEWVTKELYARRTKWAKILATKIVRGLEAAIPKMAQERSSGARR